jgi:RNA polymerase sigma-70 factor (ECF subfamily)
MRKVVEKESTVEFDTRVVAMINSGSTAEREEGFSILFKKYNRMIFIFLNKSVYFDEETAKDLLMDTFTKVLVNIDSFKIDKSGLSTWIYNIAKNTMIDYKRKEKQSTLSLDSLTENTSNRDGERFSKLQVLDNSISNDLFGLMVRDERAKALANALEGIKRAEYKKVLILFYLEEKSYAEIMDELNFSYDLVKVLLHRAKSALKVSLEKQGFKN